MELLVGRRAERLDAARRRLVLDRGEELPFDQLLVATGSEPRRLPHAERFDNTHVLRTLADAAALAAELRPGSRLAVVGAGFIGQEAAATARGLASLGVEVTIVEAAEAPLAAVLGPGLGGWFARLHRDDGVEYCSRRESRASTAAGG